MQTLVIAVEKCAVYFAIDFKRRSDLGICRLEIVLKNSLQV